CRTNSRDARRYSPLARCGTGPRRSLREHPARVYIRRGKSVHRSRLARRDRGRLLCDLDGQAPREKARQTCARARDGEACGDAEADCEEACGHEAEEDRGKETGQSGHEAEEDRGKETG